MKTWHWVVIVLGLIVLPVVIGAYSMWFRAATLPAAVAGRVFNPDRVVTTYEWFHEAATTIDARHRQIAAHGAILAAETDAAERRRITIELSGMQQSCRQLAADYNARSNMDTRVLFRGYSLPTSIDLAICG